MVAAAHYPPCNNPDCDEREHTSTTSSSKSTTASSGDGHLKCELAAKCVEACAAYGRVCPCAARAAGRAASEAVTNLRENSAVFTSAEPCNDMKKLNPNDLVIGEKLGEGGFSLVNACTMKSEPDKKLAVKYLKRRVMVNPKQFAHGAADLAQEAQFLSVLDHPNIISLHGVTAGSVETNVATGKECGFFITVDRLYDTLERKIEKWREEQQQQQKSASGLLGFMSTSDHNHKEKKKEELRERVQIALEIATAVEYLHDKNIIYRDLKPDNIAYDENGVLKLFDFGLAKELKPGEGHADGRYELTGNTGSRRYMAPEVAKELPYNKSVDVYSFGILLHELLTAEKPFFGYSSGKHMSLVVMGGERPKMDHRHTACWPMNLQWLMKRCWSPFPTSRPTFEVIRQTLQDVLDGKESIMDIRQPAQKTEVEPPAGGFSSLLKPRRASKGSKTIGVVPNNNPAEQKDENVRERRRSWGWVFRK